ncbi:hypothetical protein SLEP1_g53800 [Rubroshorea leprosula]|uniref:Uncharacterized protein n=1 Tax=Rubroshorea leprosula TaxID=152421 RepID=A0AAV5MCU3_9ROSI|nr:hypothetical protein SLEP1_g53800 [Rubroshorea leprosula]
MQHEPKLMFNTLKHHVDEFCGPEHSDSGSDDGHETANAALGNSLARPFHNMPYLVSCSLTAINNSGFYYCNEDEYNAAVESGAIEDEQWSYCCT